MDIWNIQTHKRPQQLNIAGSLNDTKPIFFSSPALLLLLMAVVAVGLSVWTKIMTTQKMQRKKKQTVEASTIVNDMQQLTWESA